MSQKGSIEATLIFWVGIVIGVVIVGNVFLAQVFSASQTNVVKENNLTATDTFNTKARATYNTSVPLIWNATVVVTNVTNGFVFPATNYTINTTGALTTLISSFNFNDTNVSVAYSYPNRSTYSWDAGTIALWLIVALSGVVLLILIVLGQR